MTAIWFYLAILFIIFTWMLGLILCFYFVISPTEVEIELGGNK
jgi:hypothetical protein